MNKYAVIKDNVVMNIIMWDGNPPWAPPEDSEVVNIEGIFCSPGYLKNEDGSFSDPNPVIPNEDPEMSVGEELALLELKVSSLEENVQVISDGTGVLISKPTIADKG